MPDNQLIEIKISRVIPAPRWRAIRMLTRVNEFPSFVPTIKEAKVLQKHHNKFITKWAIKVENIPMQWTEEDTIALDKNIIEFRAIEGDLQEFRGQWSFSDHPHGCEINVVIYFKVEIPMLRDFAGDHLKKVITKNFEAILEAVEQRLVSTRYASYRNGDIDKIAGFCIVGHFYNIKHFERYLLEQNPGVNLPSQEFVSQLFRAAHPFKVFDIRDFRSKTGQTINGCFILATLFPDMLENDPFGAFSKVVKSCRIAEKHGMGIAELAGFTALAGEGIGHDVSKELDIPVTTGRTFTVVLVIDAVLEAAKQRGVKLEDARVAIIGGGGDIGSAAARVLADRVKHLTLTGRGKKNLNKIYLELKKTHKRRIKAAANNRDAVKDADIVICAASAARSIIETGWFKPNAIVCDVGYPKNVSYLNEPKDNVFIFDGGLARSPTPLHLPVNVGLPSDDIMYGCFAEGIILDFEKRYEHFSAGRGNIMPDKIDEMRILAKKHGFEIADFCWNGKRRSL